MNTRVLGACVPGTTLTLVGLAWPVLTLWVSTSITAGGMEMGLSMVWDTELGAGSGTLMCRSWTSLCILR